MEDYLSSENEDVVKMAQIFTDAINTFVKKNRDYGNSFEQSLDKLGPIAGVTRMYDKMNRVVSLSTGETALVKDEALRDTLGDLINYSAMYIMWLDKQKDNAEDQSSK